MKNARVLAIQILARVRATDAYLNVVLDTMLAEQPPEDPRDAGLITELCYGSTRRQLTLDAAIASFADRSLDKIEDRVLAALRIGAYQIFYSRVPRHAAVGETVQALRLAGVDRATGFVNALLRKLTSLEHPPLPAAEPRGPFLAVRESHPQWLVERWIRQFGPVRAEEMLIADNSAPAVVIRANSAKTTRDALLSELNAAGIEAEATTLSPQGITLKSPGRIEELFGYSEGLWQVQDEAAQLVGTFADIPAGAKVLDVCAAPGGKACHMAEQHTVVAMDLHRNKLGKIQNEAARLGCLDRLQMRAHDATTPLPGDLSELDAVVIDAPCTGLGTLRRHPELRYRRQEVDIARLASLQRQILENCQSAVKPGGLLIYAVCSTDTQEGADQIEMFLRSHPDFTTESPVGVEKLPLWQGHLRTLPGALGLDGFFAARLRRLY